MARRSSVREQQILDEAVKLFSESGYRETSLQDVADRLGITRPAFYYYFKSKDDLLWCLIGQLGDRLLDEAGPIAEADASPTDRLLRLMEAHVHTLLENSHAFRIYFAERHLVPPERDQRLKLGEEAYLDLIRDVIADGQRAGEFAAGEPRVLAVAVNAFANSVLRWWNVGRGMSIDDVSRMIARMATHSIRPTDESKWKARASTPDDEMSWSPSGRS